MKSNEEELIEKFKEISASYIFLKEDMYTPEDKARGGIYIMKKRVIATVCASLVLVSGIAVATNIENIKKHFDRGLGGGIETAVENGYVANPEMDFIKIENIGAKVKIEDFVMDDVNLSTNFSFEFDESITNTIDMEKVNNIELSDLIVRDEENRIIYSSPNPEAFKKYCEDNNLNYTFCEFNNNYMNSGLNGFIENKEGKYVQLIYNMYTSDKFPKSKKLYFSFSTITITEYTEGKEKKYELSGSWNATVDVPKEMYNRSEEYYRVVSCDNPDFNIYTAKVTNTGFELGLIISNIEEPTLSEEILFGMQTADDDYANKRISEEEYDDIEYGYWEYSYLSRPISLSNYKINDKQLIPSYVENENGNKYECTFSPSRKQHGIFLENNQYDFYETFDMTKYNATDRVKVVLYYYGNPVTIELEKISK